MLTLARLASGLARWYGLAQRTTPERLKLLLAAALGAIIAVLLGLVNTGEGLRAYLAVVSGATPLLKKHEIAAKKVRMRD